MCNSGVEPFWFGIDVSETRDNSSIIACIHSRPGLVAQEGLRLIDTSRHHAITLANYPPKPA